MQNPPGGPAEPALVVVDAANVVGSRPDRWWRDRAGAARRLVDTLSAAAGTSGEAATRDADAGETGAGPALSGDIVVVLEGAARAGVTSHTEGRLRVLHADGSGDDAIVAVVEDAVAAYPGRAVTVVTSDRGLRSRVEALGARTHGPSWLFRALG